MQWLNWVPLKVRGFVWKTRLDRIPSKRALLTRGVIVGFEECSMFFGGIETRDNMLLNYSFATEVWLRIYSWCGWSGTTGETIRERIDWPTLLNGTLMVKRTTTLIIMATVWFLWIARNKFIFTSKPLLMDGIVEKIKVNAFMWLKYRSNIVDVVWHRWYSSPWW